MLTVTGTDSLQAHIADWKQAGDKIAFVPTMGNLHEGHLQLVDEARKRADRLVVSIFVNPTQFGPGEDFEAYPRTEQADTKYLLARGVDLLFLPTVEAMYPQGSNIDADCVPPVSLTDKLCGLFRPGHFAGVATVVKHLFDLVKPDVAVFGEKDYQQLQVIRWLVAEHGLPVQIIGMPTVREANGLAMSSRNRYLTEAERLLAAELFASLQAVCEQLQAGERDFVKLTELASARLVAAGFKPDYVAIHDAIALAEPEQAAEWVILAAAQLGEARLIDNLRCKNSK